MDFSNIHTEDLRKAFEAVYGKLNAKISARTQIFVLVSMVLTILLGVVFFMQVSYESNVTSFEKQIESRVDDLYSQKEKVEAVEKTQPEVETSISNETITVPIEFGYSVYNPLWDYLEYGHTIEYYSSTPLDVAFYFDYEGKHYYESETFTKPQFRAFIDVFQNSVVYEKNGYMANVTIHESQVVSINWITGQDGMVKWTSEMQKGPRPLNTLETWAVNYTDELGYGFYTEQWFDTLPACKDTVNNSCNSINWSPAEEFARSMAFKQFVNDVTNQVWVLSNASDGPSRWIDAISFESLNYIDARSSLYQMPKSGWVAYQEPVIGNGTYENPEKWETQFTIKVSPGFHIAISQQGYIYATGPVGISLRESAMAYRTKMWELSKIEDLLHAIK